MPIATDLPDSIAGLSRRQAAVISVSNWRGDVARFMKDFQTLLPDGGNAPFRRRGVLGLVGLVIGLAATAWALQRWRSPNPAQTAQAGVSSMPTVDLVGRWTARVKCDRGNQYKVVF